MEGHKGKENLAPGYTGMSEFFKDMEMKNNFHKDIHVKVSEEIPKNSKDKFVTSRPNKNEFEPTSGPSMSGMVCVGSCG